MTEARIYGRCPACGRRTHLRHIKDRGYLCTHCITEEDQVLCPHCNQYHPWGDYRVLNSLGYRSVHCRRCTGPGRERVFKPLTILTEKNEEEIRGTLMFEDGVWWMPLETAIRIANGLALTDFIRDLQGKIHRGEFTLKTRKEEGEGV